MIGRLEKNVIIARSGVYKYEPQALPGLKVQGIAPDGWESKTYYNVYRPANVVMQAKDKFVKLPLIREHQAIIDGKNFRDYALGWTGDTADIAVLPNSNEIGIQSTVNLIDEEAIRMYDEGFRDVSPLYGASFKWASGKSPDGEDYDIIMDDVIDVNHLAFTRQGRGGPGVGMDSEFNEADHPRAENGQFGSGSGEKSTLKTDQEKIAETLKSLHSGEDNKAQEKIKDKVAEKVKNPTARKMAESAYSILSRYSDDLPDIETTTGMRDYAMYSPSNDKIYVSTKINSTAVENIEKGTSRGFYAQNNPVLHELGHYLSYKLDPSSYDNLKNVSMTKQDEEMIKTNLSEYATTNGAELVAEYASGVMSGKKYPDELNDFINKIVGWKGNGGFFGLINEGKKSVAGDSFPNVETLPQDTVQLDNVDFRTAIDDITSNRAEYTADEISAGVDFLHSLIKDIPDSEEKKILARLIDDFLTVKDAFPNDEAAKVAADSVVSRYDSLNAKEDNMGLFSGKAKDAVPEETPAQEAPAKPEAPAPAPAEQAPAPDAPVAPVPAAAMEVAQMPDDVTTLDDAGLRACLNGVIKALKALMPEEAAEPEHQGEAPAAADGEGDKPPMEEEKKEGAAGDSVFTMSLKSNSGLSVKAKDFFDYLNRSK